MTDREKRLEEAGEFMYRYFVMPGHAKLAKDCPNKNCPFCMWETALRETPAEELRSLGIKAQQTDKGIEIDVP